MKNRGKKELRSFLISLVQDGVVGVKAGTEVEFFGQLEIEIFQEIVNGVLPIIVKIGGVDAREDIYTLLTMDVDGIIVPMIESEYALKNFFLAYDYIKNAIRKEFSIISINIETIESYKNIDKIFIPLYFGTAMYSIFGSLLAYFTVNFFWKSSVYKEKNNKTL